VSGRARGFTLLELTCAATLFAAMLGAAVMATANDRGAVQLLTSSVGPELRARQSLERMASELRMASVRGEDRNANGRMDEGEDINGNDHFDADWDLADGTEKQASLTFNRRVDLRDADGYLDTVGVFSRAVTYEVADGRLIRIWRATDLKTGAVRVNRSVMADGVVAVRFARKGTIVTVELEYRLPAGYARDTGTLSTAISLRD